MLSTLTFNPYVHDQNFFHGAELVIVGHVQDEVRVVGAFRSWGFSTSRHDFALDPDTLRLGSQLRLRFFR